MEKSTEGNKKRKRNDEETIPEVTTSSTELTGVHLDGPNTPRTVAGVRWKPIVTTPEEDVIFAEIKKKKLCGIGKGGSQFGILKCENEPSNLAELVTLYLFDAKWEFVNLPHPLLKKFTLSDLLLIHTRHPPADASDKVKDIWKAAHEAVRDAIIGLIEIRIRQKLLIKAAEPVRPA